MSVIHAHVLVSVEAWVSDGYSFPTLKSNINLTHSLPVLTPHPENIYIISAYTHTIIFRETIIARYLVCMSTPGFGSG